MQGTLREEDLAVAIERTLVILKPDAVRRRLIGPIIARFEALGLVIEKLELRNAAHQLVDQHYPNDEGWLTLVGEKTLADYEGLGLDAKKELGTAEPVEIGRLVKGWLIEFMTGGSVVACVLRGNRAIEVVRKAVGATLPISAAPGTIRGDFSSDSPDLANSQHRPVENLIHASGNPDEAAAEVGLWFPSEA